MIRTIDYTIGSGGEISPTLPQNAGFQNEHNATQLRYTLNTGLITALKQRCAETGKLVYQFEILDGQNRFFRPQAAELPESGIVLFLLDGTYTTSAGTLTVTLTLKCVNETNGNSILFSTYPALLQLFKSAAGTAPAREEERQILLDTERIEAIKEAMESDYAEYRESYRQVVAAEQRVEAMREQIEETKKNVDESLSSGIAIKSVAVNSLGELVITTVDGQSKNLGTVKGSKGDPGEKGEAATAPKVKIGENGHWYLSEDGGSSWADLQISAIGSKGEKGEPGEKGEKGDKGDDAAVDQTYNAGSTHAQSGKAVAQAVKNVSSLLRTVQQNKTAELHSSYREDGLHYGNAYLRMEGEFDRYMLSGAEYSYSAPDGSWSGTLQVNNDQESGYIDSEDSNGIITISPDGVSQFNSYIFTRDVTLDGTFYPKGLYLYTEHYWYDSAGAYVTTDSLVTIDLKMDVLDPTQLPNLYGNFNQFGLISLKVGGGLSLENNTSKLYVKSASQTQAGIAKIWVTTDSDGKKHGHISTT